jgi:hypothetical protein
MIANDVEELTSIEAARVFGVSRPTFYLFAAEHDIPNVAPQNDAKKRRERKYAFTDVARVYKEVYGKELTIEEVERLRREAQGAPGGE